MTLCVNLRSDKAVSCSDGDIISSCSDFSLEILPEIYLVRLNKCGCFSRILNEIKREND